jgi:hypothetical protein
MGQCSEWDIDKLRRRGYSGYRCQVNYRFASQNMKKMNGYLPKEVLGEAKMFQGEVQIALFQVKSGLQLNYKNL